MSFDRLSEGLALPPSEIEINLEKSQSTFSLNSRRRPSMKEPQAHKARKEEQALECSRNSRTASNGPGTRVEESPSSLEGVPLLILTPL